MPQTALDKHTLVGDTNICRFETATFSFLYGALMNLGFPVNVCSIFLDLMCKPTTVEANFN